jgi:carbon starvation protein CstA
MLSSIPDCGGFMNNSQTIEELSKEVGELRSRLNTVICVLAIFIVLSTMTFLQTLYSAILTNPALQLMFVATIGIALFVGVLIYIDIRLYRTEN